MWSERSLPAEIRSPFPSLLCYYYLFRGRESPRLGEGEREGETENPKQAPARPAQSPTRGSNPQTARSRAGLKPGVGRPTDVASQAPLPSSFTLRGRQKQTETRAQKDATLADAEKLDRLCVYKFYFTWKPSGESRPSDLLRSDTANTGHIVLISEFIKMINLNTASACTKYL